MKIFVYLHKSSKLQNVKMLLNYNHTLFKKLWLPAALILTILIFSTNVVSSQKSRNGPPPISERIFYGGSFGLQFGTLTDIEVAPVIGFWVLPRLAVAAGPNYRFYKDPFGRTDIFGARAYTQFVVIQDLNNIIPLGLNFGLFLHAENELLSLESGFWKDPPFESPRFYINTGLVGAGMSQPMGRRSSMNVMVLWAVNEPIYKIYNTPEFRISFIF